MTSGSRLSLDLLLLLICDILDECYSIDFSNCDCEILLECIPADLLELLFLLALFSITFCLLRLLFRSSGDSGLL